MPDCKIVVFQKMLRSALFCLCVSSLLFACTNGEKPQESRAPEYGESYQAGVAIDEQELTPERDSFDKSRAAPSIESLMITPGAPRPGDDLVIEIKANISGDDASLIFSYEWHHNGQLLVGHYGDTLATEKFRKGDKIEVVATVRDLYSLGETARSASVILRNRRPQILSEPAGTRGNTFTYAVLAEDPDGDTLHYSLEKSPPGMLVDAVTGVIEWTLPRPFAPTLVLIRVSDGDDFTTQEFTMSPPSGE